MTTPTPPTPLELARVIVAKYPPKSYAEHAPKQWSDAILSGRYESCREMKIALAALTSPQHRAGIRREVLEEAAKCAETWKSSLKPGSEHRFYGHQEASRDIGVAIRQLIEDHKP